ncbi:hypothetical protein AB5J72_48505 [Streptomyces sp. CG1]|uniref:hypothetical protein n=1 Tax=Streptomyces sp. CG1 TaxID=1287523 RepID=UPI0034E2FF7E
MRDLAELVKADHKEIFLDSDHLSDPAVRAAVFAATDFPPVWYGDLWPSLYCRFRAVRERSTAALSGESALTNSSAATAGSTPRTARQLGNRWSLRLNTEQIESVVYAFYLRFMGG